MLNRSSICCFHEKFFEIFQKYIAKIALRVDYIKISNGYHYGYYSAQRVDNKRQTDKELSKNSILDMVKEAYCRRFGEVEQQLDQLYRSWHGCECVREEDIIRNVGDHTLEIHMNDEEIELLFDGKSLAVEQLQIISASAWPDITEPILSDLGISLWDCELLSLYQENYIIILNQQDVPVVVAMPKPEQYVISRVPETRLYMEGRRIIFYLNTLKYISEAVLDIKSLNPFDICIYYQNTITKISFCIYDLMGNRTTVIKTDEDGTVVESEKYVYNESNQRVSVELYDGKKTTSVSYTYDADGNLISETGSDGTDKVELYYSYTVENRLEAVYDKQELLMAAAYDGDGNRVFQLNYNSTGSIRGLLSGYSEIQGVTCRRSATWPGSNIWTAGRIRDIGPIRQKVIIPVYWGEWSGKEEILCFRNRKKQF